jgi:hypothetical protein
MVGFDHEGNDLKRNMLVEVIHRVPNSNDRAFFTKKNDTMFEELVTGNNNNSINLTRAE